MLYAPGLTIVQTFTDAVLGKRTGVLTVQPRQGQGDCNMRAIYVLFIMCGVVVLSPATGYDYASHADTFSKLFSIFFLYGIVLDVIEIFKN